MFEKIAKVKNVLETKYQKTWTVIATISSLLIKHTSNILDDIFHLHRYHRIKSGVEHFLVRTKSVRLPTCQQTRILKIRIQLIIIRMQLIIQLIIPMKQVKMILMQNRVCLLKGKYQKQSETVATLSKQEC